MTTYIYKDELYHHGIKGQKWGVRRFQNTDGSYTTEGRQRRSDSYPDEKSERRKKIAKRVAIGAAVVGGTILVAYGAKRISDLRTNDKATETLIKNLTKTSAKLKEENSFWDKEANRTAHEYYKLSSDKNLGKKVSDDDISSARKRAQDSHFALSNVWDKQRDVERALSTAKWARQTNPYSRVKDKIKKRG